MRFVKPDWNNNILNLTASLAEYLGCHNGKPVLPGLRQALSAGYKNVVLLILDGMGVYPMRQNLGEGAFLRRHTVRSLTSVFPSTTTNATTTLRTGLFPMEHGWFGWSLYFKDAARCVDLFPCADSYTGEKLGRGFTEARLPTVSFYTRGDAEIARSVVVPPYWDGDEENRYIHRSFAELADGVERICKREGRQFVYAYCDMPDSVMHRFGVASPEARENFAALDRGTEELFGRLSDTLLIVTADHGQTDIAEKIEIYKDGELCSLLSCPPYLEARAAAFRVKRGNGVRFSELFLRKYGEDFALFKSRDLIRRGYFGPTGGAHAELLGDFIAVGKTDKMMQLSPLGHDFKGHHTSLTEEEMTVPLILAGRKE